MIKEVKEELKELKDKLSKLKAFMNTKKFLELESEHNILISEQLFVMERYAEILAKRLDIFKDTQ